MEKIATDFAELESVATPTLGSTNPGEIVGAFAGLVIPIAGFLLLFYLIYAGWQWMTSAGDPKTLQAAKNNITYAVVGIIVVITAYSVARLFGVVLRLPGIADLFP